MPNERVRIVEERLLSDHWYTLKTIAFDWRRSDGRWQRQHREAYDRGNGAVLLLFNAAAGTVVLTRQFRMPAYLNGCDDGLLIEACAGLLDGEDPETCIRREAVEETGYRIRQPRKVFEAYMSPGSVTEKLHFFVAACDGSAKVREPRWLRLPSTTSFILADNQVSGGTEALLSFWGEPFMAQATGRDVPRFIFHVQRDSELLPHLVELQRDSARGEPGDGSGAAA